MSAPKQSDKINEAARLLGSRGGKRPKTLTPAERERRRVAARGLAKMRAEKRAPTQTNEAPKSQTQTLISVQVIDRQGRKWRYEAESVQHAVTLARHDGIDAVGGRVENQTKGKQQ